MPEDDGTLWKVREQRRDATRAELKSLAPPRRAEVHDVTAIRAELAEYLQDWNRPWPQ